MCNIKLAVKVRALCRNAPGLQGITGKLAGTLARRARRFHFTHKQRELVVARCKSTRKYLLRFCVAHLTAVSTLYAALGA